MQGGVHSSKEPIHCTAKVTLTHASTLPWETLNVNPFFHPSAASLWLFPSRLLIRCPNAVREERMDGRIVEMSSRVLRRALVVDAFSSDKTTGRDHRA